jgi:error-prone DNA polymerase
MHNIPAGDTLVYQMIQRADTIGVFQIESRAQMSMLPRLRPACFYDLVIEVAIVRPGPIQGDMVHPYLRRRQGLEPVSYPSDAVRDVLERTLGVPIFQEQVIKLAMVAAGFSPGEADQLRRSMAAWKRRGDIALYQQKLMQGMCERGYEEEFAQRILRQIQGFGEYGFPESHAASFALLVYVSAWLKCHLPAAFTAALINSLPMGFYAPAQLVRDAREHQVEVLPVDVNASHWDCTLEARGRRVSLRLGMCLVKGMSRRAAEAIAGCREAGQFRQVDEMAHRAQLNRADLKALAAADALAALSEHRHQAYWDVAGVEAQLPILPDTDFHETRPELLPPTDVQDVVADYAQLGLSLRCHPLSLLREELGCLQVLSAAEIGCRPAGEVVHLAGLVITRQRPGKGNAVFITLEDETGILNLIIWRQLAEQQRRILLGARLLGAWAEIQRADGVQHMIVKRLEDHTDRLVQLQVKTRDFH